jgi:hypothetical protein
MRSLNIKLLTCLFTQKKKMKTKLRYKTYKCNVTKIYSEWPKVLQQTWPTLTEQYTNSIAYYNEIILSANLIRLILCNIWRQAS